MMIKIFVLIIGLLLVGLIFWWFFGKHKISTGESKVLENGQLATVIVNGGYNPAVLKLKQGIPTRLVFNRKDASSCLEHVVFSDFGIDKVLPLNKDVEISLDALKAGEYNYACGMNMFHGKIIVK
ncbi:MAG TPA: cupredoxin domain-containing protein [Lactovum miscens]|uniref:cupredoxin domain-containing protein n=1 Tax=Lactovum miscens TaxID=190387 RepID=UPI002EDA4FB0